MHRLDQMFAGVSTLPDSRLGIHYESGLATVSFPGGRKQRISIVACSQRYAMTSRVMGKSRVSQFGLERLMERIWDRNRTTDIVEFTLDGQGRLIGRIEQLKASSHKGEILFAIWRLAEECDRLEYVLTGRDEA